MDWIRESRKVPAGFKGAFGDIVGHSRGNQPSSGLCGLFLSRKQNPVCHFLYLARHLGNQVKGNAVWKLASCGWRHKRTLPPNPKRRLQIQPSTSTAAWRRSRRLATNSRIVPRCRGGCVPACGKARRSDCSSSSAWMASASSNANHAPGWWQTQHAWTTDLILNSIGPLLRVLHRVIATSGSFPFEPRNSGPRVLPSV
jgi:hypothetical protein